MPFVTAGFPSLNITAEIIPALEQAGASIVEVGFPFSDPLADGPVIAASMHEALLGGITPSRIFKMIHQLRPHTSLGLIAMVSHSIVHRMGEEEFLQQAGEAGFDGFILPDMDTGSLSSFLDLIDKRDFSFSLLISPTTSQNRVAQLTACCRGFVYVLARVGITGEQATTPQIASQVDLLRSASSLPLAVGFGISTPEHVTAVTQVADAAIIGSALMRRIQQSDDPASTASTFVAELAQGLVQHPSASAGL